MTSTVDSEGMISSTALMAAASGLLAAGPARMDESLAPSSSRMERLEIVGFRFLLVFSGEFITAFHRWRVEIPLESLLLHYTNHSISSYIIFYNAELTHG